ncbi:MAG: DUF1007 family protein [Rhodobacteraceae bacterium]|nr:DUF1007 family protein [Paracoccaceae bacterium]
MMRSTCLACGLGAALAAPVAAHPHIFVDTALRVVLDDQSRIAGVEVVWRYDELYSMLTFEDRGLDSDYDGRLSPAETAILSGFDMNWVPGFEGDLYVMADGGAALRLGPPEPRGLTVRDGQIVTTHFRPLAQPVPAAGVVLRAYDPTFYTAYDLTEVTVSGTGCAALVERADVDAAYARLQDLLAALPDDGSAAEYPEVGAAFADSVVLSCRR